MNWWNVTLLVVVGFGVAVSCGSADGAVPTVGTGKAPVRVALPPVKARSVNTHVRVPVAGVEPKKVAGTPGKTAKVTPHRTTIVRATPHHRVVAHPRHVVRHLTGSVSGYVTSGEGAVRGARVCLRGAKGHKFRSAARRHVVYTDAGGSFVMRRVRTGSYRVFASKSGVGSGHTQLAMHTSGMHRVEVHLGGAKKHK
jgi:hypothetical protein